MEDRPFPALRKYLENDIVRLDPPRTSEDEDVWRHALQNLQTLWKTHEGWFFRDYLIGIDSLDINTMKVPSLSDINRMLAPIGWAAIYVDGMVNDRLYHEMQASRFFPVARKLRRKRDIEHSAAPDFIHDVIGHLPMLFASDYRSLVSEWAQRALDAFPDTTDREVTKALAQLIDEHERDQRDQLAIEHSNIALRELLREARGRPPSRAARFARFYAWAVEFGVSRDDSHGVRITGSATLSSSGDLQRLFDGETEYLDFSKYALDTPVDYTVTQTTMYAVRSFSDYNAELRKI
jgi:phenylalanine-4-hydroxylase